MQIYFHLWTILFSSSSLHPASFSSLCSPPPPPPFPQGQPVNPGPSPPNYVSKLLSLLPPVVFDNTLSGKNFGDVHTDAKPQYSPVSTTVVTVLAMLIWWLHVFPEIVENCGTTSHCNCQNLEYVDSLTLQFDHMMLHVKPSTKLVCTAHIHTINCKKLCSCPMPSMFETTPSISSLQNQTVEVQFWAGNPRNNLMVNTLLWHHH